LYEKTGRLKGERSIGDKIHWGTCFKRPLKNRKRKSAGFLGKKKGPIPEGPNTCEDQPRDWENRGAGVRNCIGDIGTDTKKSMGVKLQSKKDVKYIWSQRHN